MFLLYVSEVLGDRLIPQIARKDANTSVIEGSLYIHKRCNSNHSLCEAPQFASCI